MESNRDESNRDEGHEGLERDGRLSGSRRSMTKYLPGDDSHQARAKRRKAFNRQVGGGLYPHQRLELNGKKASEKPLLYGGGFEINPHNLTVTINVYEGREHLRSLARVLPSEIAIGSSSYRLEFKVVKEPQEYGSHRCTDKGY